MAQEVSCRSQDRSRSSYFLSSHCAAESQLLLSSRPNHQFPSHFRMPLCRRLHLVTSLSMCRRRRLFNKTRFRVMWLFRRLPKVPISYPWMLPRERPHPVPCLNANWLVMADFGQDRLDLLCCVLSVWRGTCFTVSEWGFMSGSWFQGLVWTALPLDRPSPGPPFPSPKISLFFFPLSPQNSFFSSLSGGLLVEFWCF